MTGGAEINFGGAREIYPTLEQMKKVRRKNFKEFSSRFSRRNRNSKRFFRPKTGDLKKKKKGLHSKNVTKSGVSPQKTLICASICTPEAPSLLIFSGHSPRLGGAQFSFRGAQAASWGGTAPVCPPVAPGLLGLYSSV